MAIKEFIIKALCMSICMASSSTSSNYMTRDFIDHVLRIPYPDKVLNSVLGRLEKDRQQRLNSKPDTEDSDCERSENLPEYTESLQARERDIRHLGSQVRKLHYPICHMDRKVMKLNTLEYEYRPAYYEEVRCIASNNNEMRDIEVCSSLGFSCVQWNKTIHLTRRRYSSDCWETWTMIIPAGCECMWPTERLGEMKLHA